MLDLVFVGISRFVAMAGIGGIAQTVSADLIAPLANEELSEEAFADLQRKAEMSGYVLEKA